ncbi:MAG: hypothetical protein ACRDRZ_07600 [Pseudonocardiaceae bacterium]
MPSASSIRVISDGADEDEAGPVAVCGPARSTSPRWVTREVFAHTPAHQRSRVSGDDADTISHPAEPRS